MGQQHHAASMLDPAGHVVLSFPTALQAARAARALGGIGLSGTSVLRLSDRQMLERLDDELARAGRLARRGAYLAFARDHLRRAEGGYHWLVVRASNDGRACQVVDCVHALGVLTGRYYGHLAVEELLDAGVRWRAAAPSREAPPRMAVVVGGGPRAWAAES